MTEPVSSTFYDRNYGWILLIFVLSIPAVACGIYINEKSNNNNIKQWLPKDDLEETKTYKEFCRHFGTDEYAIVSWKGCTLDDPRLQRFAKLAREYRDEDDDKLFVKVQTGPELLAQLQQKPFGLSETLARKRLTSIVIGRDNKASAAIIELTVKGDDNRQAAVAALRNILEKQIKIPSDDIHMAGDAVTNAAVDVESQKAMNSLVIYSTLVALVCALLSLRSLKLVVVVFITAIFSSTLAESLVPALGGQMNLVLVVMPALIYVLSLSAGVHLVNYYRDAVREFGTAKAPLIAVKHAWLPCMLAAGTTAVGLASLSVSKIVPVKDFGTYSAIGIVASLIVLFLLLPAMLVFSQKFSWKKDGRNTTPSSALSRPHKFDSFVQFVARCVLKQHAVVAFVCLAILGFFGWGAIFINTSVKPARFFPEDHRLIADYHWLASPERFGNQIPLEIMLEFDRKRSPLTTLSQLQLVEEVEKELITSQSKYVTASISAVTFAPELDDTHYTRYVMNKRIADARGDYGKVHYYSYEDPNKQASSFPPSSPASDDTKNETAVEGTEVEPQVGKDIWRISTRLRPNDDDYDEVIAKIEQNVNGYLKRRGQLSVEKQKKATVQFEKVKEKIHANKLEEMSQCDGSDDPETCRRNVAEKYDIDRENLEKRFENAMRKAADDTKGVTVHYTGMVPLFHIAQRELLNGLFKSFLLAFLIIAVMMIFWFRSFAAGVVTMLPNVFPAAVIFGWMGWTDRIVDIGSMMTASVAMGIAVDDTVHFLTWFRRGMQENMTRREAVLYGYKRCALAMAQTTTIAGLGLLVFSFSSFQPVSQFGLLMFLLLAAALVGDLLFLPALLSGPAGKLFEPKSNASKPTSSKPVAMGKTLQPS